MNFRHILSKSSLKSSSTTEKGVFPSEEESRSEVELLKQTIESLKISVESRDAAIGTLAREKEKLYIELKSAQRTNRNLRQQLEDERYIHHKEKNYFVEELGRLSKKNFLSCNNIERNILDKQSESSLKEELKSKDEVIYNIGAKFLKIRSSKERLLNKQHKLQQRSQQTCERVIMLLHEHKVNLNNILTKFVKAAILTPRTKSYLNLLDVNANLWYENVQLKVFLSLKDFSYEHLHEEKSSQAKHEPKKIKSQTYTRNSKYIHHHSSLQLRNFFTRIQKNKSIDKFSFIHKMLAPYLRRKRLYNSESNLATFPYEIVNQCTTINY